jgi:hypothetical protein
MATQSESRPPSARTEFEFGLDLILDGLDRLRVRSKE